MEEDQDNIELPLGNDPERIPEPDLEDSDQIPDPPESSQRGVDDEDGTEVESLKQQVGELRGMIERLVDQHDSDFKDTEQEMKIARLIEQVNKLQSDGIHAYPDADNDPNPIPYLWLGADDGTNIKEQAINSNTIVTMTAGRTVTNTATLTIASSLGFYYEFLDFNGGAQVMRRVKIAGNNNSSDFPVKLSSPSSATGGNASTACTISYTVKDRNNNSIGTTLHPIEQDTYDVGERFAAGDWGVGWYESDGTTFHFSAFEELTAGTCDSMGGF